MADDASEIIEFPRQATVKGKSKTDNPAGEIIHLSPEEARFKGVVGKITKTFSGSEPVDHSKLPGLAMEFAKASLAKLEGKGPGWDPEDIAKITRLEGAIHEAEGKEFLTLGQIIREYGDVATKASERNPMMAAVGTAFGMLAENISAPPLDSSKIVSISSKNSS